MTDPTLPTAVLYAALDTIKRLPPEIRWFGDPVLRQVADPFTPDEIEAGEARVLAGQLTDVLARTRRDTGLGLGLAAPQIGISRRMFVAFDPQTSQVEAYTNPRIVAASQDKGIYAERCLSGVPLAASVVRPWQIELEYQDLDGALHRVSADPMFSRLAQHEVDHLDGILFTDRADPATISFQFDWDEFRKQNKLMLFNEQPSER